MRRMRRSIQWPVVGAFALAAFLLGFVGFSRFFSALGEPRSPWDVLYLTLQLFVLESGSVWGPVPWELQVGRLLAPAVAGYAAVGALALLFREQFHRLRGRFFRRHVIICALGRKGFLLTKSLRARGERVIVIEEDAENDRMETAREHGAIVLVGDARDPRMLQKAGAIRARHLVSVSGEDGVNAEVAVQARSLVSGRRTSPLHCLVHVVDSDLCNLLRMQEIGRRKEGPFCLDFFNVFEGGARALLKEFPIQEHPEDPSVSECRMVVVGLGRFGENLIQQAARQWRREREETKIALSVVVVDQDATARVDALLGRYPWLAQICRFEAVNVSTESRTFAEAPFLFDDQGAPMMSFVFICVDDDSRGISAGLTLHRRLKHTGIPIVVRTAHGQGLASLLREDRIHAGEYSNLYAFGLLEHTCNPDLLFAGANEVLARAMHEDYVEDQDRLGQTPETNPVMVPWEDLGDGARESNRAQAAHIGVKLAAVGCDLSPLVDWDAERFAFDPGELELLARMEHDRWVEERRRDGWKLGPRKSDKKTSPHLIPWEDLGEETRELDRSFIRGLPRFLARAGFQIVRVRRSPSGVGQNPQGS